MSVFLYINVHILKRGVGRMPAEKKITVTIFVGGRKSCDDKVENRDFLCFKISGVNGVLDIFLDILESSKIYYFFGGGVGALLIIHIYSIFITKQIILSSQYKYIQINNAAQHIRIYFLILNRIFLPNLSVDVNISRF